MDDVLYLLSSVSEQDDNGVWQNVYTWRRVFCKRGNITRSEFFNAGRNGLNADIQLSIFGGDYEGEELLSYHDETYSIYRTFRTGDDYIELYCERKAGTHGKGND